MHLRSLIPQCRAQSAAVEKRLADTIITLEINRIEAIYALEKRLGELRAIILVYIALNLIYEHVNATQIIDLDLRLIAAKTKQFPLHLLKANPPAPHSPATDQLTLAFTIKRYG